MSGLPNGNGWHKKSGIKGLQMFAADVMGNTADMLFLRFQENIDKALPFLKGGFKTVMYTPFKILQTPLEWTINKLGGGIEGDEAREARMNQPQEQRLDGLLESGYHYTAAGLVGLGTLMATEKALSRFMGTGHVPNKVWWTVDFPVHLGTAALLGSSAMKPATDNIKGTMKKIMVASGWSEEKAEQDSRFVIAYILPNYITLIPTALSMGSLYYGASKGVLNEVQGAAHSSFHTVPGRSFSELENGVAKNMLSLLQKMGNIEGPVKSFAQAL